MPGTRYDEDLDNWIVRILLDSRRLELGHNQLQALQYSSLVLSVLRPSVIS